MTEAKLTRRHLFGGVGALAGATTLGYLGTTFAQGATPTAGGAPGAATPVSATPVAATPVTNGAPISEWPFYGNTILGAKFTTTANLNSGNAANLKLAWTAQLDGPTSSTPVIGEGLVVIGAYDSKLRAFAPETGDPLWIYDTGANVTEPNLKIPIGVTGSAAIVDGVVYSGDSAGKLHAIDAATGQAKWVVDPSSQSAASIWSSPVVSQGVLFIGIASVAKESGFRGAVVAVDMIDGKTIWQHFVTPDGSDGGGVFAVPALDVERGLLFVGTQNAYTAGSSDYGDVISVLALDMATGDKKWAFAGTHAGGDFGPTDDVGFSASPNLFTASIDGKTRDLVGNGQKNGVYHVLDRDTGEVVWETTISSAGPLGGMEGTSAVGTGVIVVPATEWTGTDNNAKGLVRALDTAAGTILWTLNQSAPNPAPVAISNDVAFQAGIEGVLRALALNDGTELFSFDLGASVSGGIAVAGDLVILGAATPGFASFVKAGTQLFAFSLAGPIAGASPVASPVVPVASPVGSTPSTPVVTEPPPAASPGATPIG